VQSKTHLLLLTARAFVRLYRFKEARAVLQSLPPMVEASDEDVTAQMVAGEIAVRSGEVRHGLDILRAAEARSSRAHRTIRQELALDLALAHYCLHEFDVAEQLLATIPPDADLVHARAIQYHGWIAFARGATETARVRFVDALRALDAGNYRDRYLEASCVRVLAHLAAERMDRPTWEFVRKRRVAIDWSAKNLIEPHYFIAYCAATYELDAEGNAVSAAREARHAEELAPNEAFRVQARCKRAAIAHAVGEPVARHDHLDAAAELFATLDLSKLAGDEKVVPLILAEELADCRPSDALLLIDRYLSLSPPAPMRISAQSPLGEAYRYFVEGHAMENAGRRNEAIRAYRTAFETFRRCTYTRRAVMSALALWRLTGDQRYAKYASTATRALSSRSALRQKVAHQIAPAIRLTAVQREVIALICQGKSNPEIARLRKRSLHTVRNLVARLFELFEVQSREQLAVECVRRGLYSPG
jgi:DNA-binding CsgD family transcriptional regulator/tetratricopeptide (TPR) repeat protein